MWRMSLVQCTERCFEDKRPMTAAGRTDRPLAGPLLALLVGLCERLVQDPLLTKGLPVQAGRSLGI